MSKKYNAKIAAGAAVVGDVVFGENCSVWYNAVIRGDQKPILVGDNTNIQDGCILHVSPDWGIKLGRGVSLGHGAILHGTEVGDNSLIGMGAILLNGSKIGKDSLVAAGSLVPQGAEFPDGVLIMGSPAKVIRKLGPEEVENNRIIAERYVKLSETIEAVLPY